MYLSKWHWKLCDPDCISYSIMTRFVPRERKHKVRHRSHYGSKPETASSSNKTEIVPQDKLQKDAKKKLLEDSTRTQETPMSSKKKKRLDKYIVFYSLAALYFLHATHSLSLGY